MCRWWKASGERSASSRPREPGVPLAPAEQGASGAPAARQGFPPAVGSAATPASAAPSRGGRGAAPTGATGEARSGWADTNEKSARGLWDLTWKGSDGLSSLHVRAQPHPQCSRSAGKIASLMFAPPEEGDVASREHWKEHAEACELGGLTPAQQPRSAPRSTRCGHRCPPRHFGKARPSIAVTSKPFFFSSADSCVKPP